METEKLETMTQFPLAKDLLSFRPQGVFFDLDGTLFHSEPFHAEVLWNVIKSVSPSTSFSSPRQLEELFCGVSDLEVYQYLRKEQLIGSMDLMDFEQAKRPFFSEENFAKLPDSLCPEEIQQCLRDLRREGVPMGIVTSSESYQLKAFLKRYLRDVSFDILLCREDTPENKPSPMPYQRAAEQLRLDVRKCLIVEDSAVGLESAKASGAAIIKAQWYSTPPATRLRAPV